MTKDQTENQVMNLIWRQTMNSNLILKGHVKQAKEMIDAGNTSAAVQVLDPYLHKHPQDAEALYWYATALYRSKDNNNAEKAFRRLVTEAPKDDRASYGLAITLIRLNRLEDARYWLQATLNLNPKLDRARKSLEELDALLSKDGPSMKATVTDSDVEADRHLVRGDLLRSGTRRLSSFSGQFAIAALLIILGLVLIITNRFDRASWLAERMTTTRIAFLEETLVVFQQSGAIPYMITAVEAELDAAYRDRAARAAQLDRLLEILAIAMPIIGTLLVIHARLAASRTSYAVYERRIDVEQGVLNRSLQSVWLYQIKDVRLLRPFYLNVTNNALISLLLEDKSIIEIIGFGPYPDQERLREELTNAALIERRALRRWWV
jgi:tetratricopeptide (TPR) repeat protein